MPRFVLYTPLLWWVLAGIHSAERRLHHWRAHDLLKEMLSYPYD